MSANGTAYRKMPTRTLITFSNSRPAIPALSPKSAKREIMAATTRRRPAKSVPLPRRPASPIRRNIDGLPGRRRVPGDLIPFEPPFGRLDATLARVPKHPPHARSVDGNHRRRNGWSTASPVSHKLARNPSNYSFEISGRFTIPDRRFNSFRYFNF